MHTGSRFATRLGLLPNSHALYGREGKVARNSVTTGSRRYFVFSCSSGDPIFVFSLVTRSCGRGCGVVRKKYDLIVWRVCPYRPPYHNSHAAVP